MHKVYGVIRTDYLMEHLHKQTAEQEPRRPRDMLWGAEGRV